mgnify:CR=1 FL=1
MRPLFQSQRRRSTQFLRPAQIGALLGAILSIATPAAATDCWRDLSHTRAAGDSMRANCTTPACATIVPGPASCPADALTPALTALRNADKTAPTIVLLGEVHDNPHHHRLRAALIADAANASATPVVEHLPVTLQPAVDEFYAKSTPGTADPAAFFDAVTWSKLGWPDASMFAPLYGRLLRQTSPIVAADVPKDRIRKLARREPAALDDAERKRLRLDEPFPEPLQNDLLTELEASHCGLMPKTAFTGMATAQNYRDAHIAAAALAAARKSGTAIVIAGNGHVRRDRAIPYYIRLLAPEARVMTVALLEEGNEHELANAANRYDLAIITPAATRPDPCEEMRKMRSKSPKN